MQHIGTAQATARGHTHGHGAVAGKAESGSVHGETTALAREANFHARHATDGQVQGHHIDMIDGDCCDRGFARCVHAWNGFEDRHEALARSLCPTISFGLPALALVGTSVALAGRGDLGMAIGAGCFAGMVGLTWLGCVAFRIGSIARREARVAKVQYYLSLP